MLALYALETRWLTWDRFYKLYVTRQAVCGAFLAAQAYDERTAEMSSGGVAMLRKMARRQVELRHRREADYDGMDPASPAFALTDERNFTIPRIEIREVALRVRFSVWTASKAGVLTIGRTVLSKMRLVLPPSQPPTALEALAELRLDSASLDRFGAVVQTTGREKEQAEAGEDAPHSPIPS